MARQVRVKSLNPPGHLRTPHYLRGKCGTIERELDAYPNPEQLAYGLMAAKQKLYRVRFTMAELWGGGVEQPQDTVDAEIYAHWLEFLDAA